MKLLGEGKLLRIFIGESDKYHHIQLFEAIVKKAREEKLAGATVIRGEEGFGARSVLHKATLVDISADLPIVVEIVDTPEKIDAFIPRVDAMIEETKCGAMVTVEKVEVRKYIAGK